MTKSRAMQTASLVAALLSMLLLSIHPVTAQAFQPQALPAYRPTPKISDVPVPYLSMSPDLLAAANEPGGDRGHYKMAQAKSGESGAPSGRPSMEELSAEMDNPLGKLWMMFLQNDTLLYDGNPLGEEVINMTVFMPVLSIPLTQKINLVVRPILPFISAPKPNLPSNFGRFPDEFPSQPPFNQIVNQPSISTDREFEFGDMMLMTAFGPSDLVGGKFVMGLGPTFMFPTASDDFFGTEKWSAGPAAILVYLGKPWKLGFIAQHWVEHPVYDLLRSAQAVEHWHGAERAGQLGGRRRR
jgi:hypothetical protein